MKGNINGGNWKMNGRRFSVLENAGRYKNRHVGPTPVQWRVLLNKLYIVKH